MSSQAASSGKSKHDEPTLAVIDDNDHSTSSEKNSKKMKNDRGHEIDWTHNDIPQLPEDALKDTVNPEYAALLKKYPRPPEFELDKKGRNPEERANPCSLLSFSFIQPLMTLGYQRPLSEKDLWPLNRAQDCITNAPQFEEIYYKTLDDATEYNDRMDRENLERIKRGEAPIKFTRRTGNILKTAFVYSWQTVVVLLCLQALSRVIAITSPYVLKELLAWLSNQNDDIKMAVGYYQQWYGWLMAVLLAALYLFVNLLDNVFFHIGYRNFVQLKGCTNALLYTKSLKAASFTSPADQARQAAAQTLAAAKAAAGNAGKKPGGGAGGGAKKGPPPPGAAGAGTGAITNLMSLDSEKLAMMFYMGLSIVFVPIQIAVLVYLIHRIIGHAILVGLGVIFVLIPVSFFCMLNMANCLRRKFLFADKRIKATMEALSGIKVLKFQSWELFQYDMISSIRREESNVLFLINLMFGIISCIMTLIGPTVTVITFLLYSVLEDKFDPVVVFQAVSLISVLGTPIIQLPNSLTTMLVGVVSAKRLDAFLSLPELPRMQQLDTDVLHRESLPDNDPTLQFINTGLTPVELQRNKDMLKQHDAAIMIKNASFSYTTFNEEYYLEVFKPELVTKGKKAEEIEKERKELQLREEMKKYKLLKTTQPKVLHNIDFVAKKGALIGVIGTVGSSKTSLMNALLGELSCVEGTVYRDDSSIAYVAQRPWIQTLSIRDNITWSDPEMRQDVNANPEKKKRYYDAIKACALYEDLYKSGLFELYDLTEVGSVSLSGGQQQRLNLCRAVYAQADIYILDDILSALDAHVAEHVFQHCIEGVIKDKTRILITNQLHHLQRCDYIYIMGLKEDEDIVIDQDGLRDFEKNMMEKLKPKVVVDNKKDGNKKGGDNNNNHDDDNTVRNRGATTGGKGGSNANSPANSPAMSAKGGDKQLVDPSAQLKKALVRQVGYVADHGTFEELGRRPLLGKLLEQYYLSLSTEEEKKKEKAKQEELQRQKEQELIEAKLKAKQQQSHKQHPASPTNNNSNQLVVQNGSPQQQKKHLPPPPRKGNNNNNAVLPKGGNNLLLARDEYPQEQQQEEQEQYLQEYNAEQQYEQEMEDNWDPVSKLVSQMSRILGGGGDDHTHDNLEDVDPALTKFLRANQSRRQKDVNRFIKWEREAAVKAAETQKSNKIVIGGNVEKGSRVSKEELHTSNPGAGLFLFHLSTMNGPLWITITLLVAAMAQGCVGANNIILSYWSEDKWNQSEDWYFRLYGGLLAASAGLMILRGGMWAVACSQSSRFYHNKLLYRVLRSTNTFFDITPLGRTIARFSDLDAIDTMLPNQLLFLVSMTCSLISHLVSVCVVQIWFVIPSVLILVSFYSLQSYASHASVQLKRIESLTKSPFLHSFGETVRGISTIRAFKGRVLQSQRHFFGLLNRNINALLQSVLAIRYLNLRVGLLVVVLILVAGLIVCGTRGTLTVGVSGMMLSSVLSIGNSTGFLLMMLIEVSSRMSSVERLRYYSETVPLEPPLTTAVCPVILDDKDGKYQRALEVAQQQHTANGSHQHQVVIKHQDVIAHQDPFLDYRNSALVEDEENNGKVYEPRYDSNGNEIPRVITFHKLTDDHLPKKILWPPKKYNLKFNNVWFRYRPELPYVLHGLTFSIPQGQTVGLVGRTGCGKSSTLQLLLRLYDIQKGSISLGDIDISHLPLKLLRQQFGVIPQEPTIYSGTVRTNLDPFNEFTNDDIQDVLQLVGLYQMINALDNGMNSFVDANSSFSVGERQLLVFARCLLRRKDLRVVLIDEGSANLDSQSDLKIQQLLREYLAHCTIVTIAHRISTIVDYDRVIVLDRGTLMEYGPPQHLIDAPVTDEPLMTSNEDDPTQPFITRGTFARMYKEYVKAADHNTTNKEKSE